MKEKRLNDRETHPEIAVLTVLKKGAILKNIFLNSPQSPEHRRDDNVRFLVGRHPDCHIVLDHPSISRFHVELLVRAPSRKLVVTDLSSVHGTWVSGRRIEPRVAVEVGEGETLKLGASTRVYVVRLVPLGGQFEWENLLESVSEEKEETLHEEELLREKVSLLPITSESMVYPDLDAVPVLEHNLVPSVGPEETVSHLPVEELQRFAENSAVPCRENLSPPISEKQTAPSSLLSRRMKSISHLQIHSGRGRREGRERGGGVDFSLAEVEELAPKVLFSNDDDENEVHLSEKENITPAGSSNRKTAENATGLVQRSCWILGESLGGGGNGQEISGDQEVGTCDGSLQKLPLDLDSEGVCDSDRESSTPIGGNAKLEEGPLCRQKIKEEEHEDDMFAENKENRTPNFSGTSKVKKKKALSESRRRMNSAITKKRVERVPFQSLLDNSISNPPSSNVSSLPIFAASLEQEESISENRQRTGANKVKNSIERVPFQSLLDDSITKAKSPSSRNSGGFKASGNVAENMSIQREHADGNIIERVPFQVLVHNYGQPTSDSGHGHGKEIPKPILERVPFQALVHNSIGKSSSSIVSIDPWKACSPSNGSEIISETQPEKQPLPSAAEKMKWNIVVDMSCFTDDESRRSLQLLEGIRGTQLIIPRMVIRELDYLTRRESLFRRATKASMAMQWIEECMVNSSWWIHVQSSGEMVPVAPTPPATPPTGGNGVGDECGCSPNSKAFSAWGSLVEIVSPTAEDHILDCTLLFKRLKADEQIVLLTNSTALKIKAMAEGLLCETPKEFRASLVNPYSERFLWVESSPRGPTWSLSEEVEKVKNLYHHDPSVRKPTAKAADTAWGLKLILLHNFHYGQMSTVR